MWRDPFLNFCFVILLMIMVTLRHTPGPFDLNKHGGTATAIDLHSGYPAWSGTELMSGLRDAEGFRRARALLDHLWKRAAAVEEWWMDYTAWQWERFNASSPAETDLLEARFHVATAEVFTDPMGKNGRAVRELERAETSINAAQSLAGPKLASELSSIREEIAAAERREQDQQALPTAPFETIKTDLDHLVAMLRSS